MNSKRIHTIQQRISTTDFPDNTDKEKRMAIASFVFIRVIREIRG
jgi:hypothetical protein